MTLGQVLVELRKEKAVSMAKVRSVANISPPQLSLIERDEYKPTMAVLGRLAKYYNTTIYDIFREVSGYQDDRGVFETLVNWSVTPNNHQTNRWTHVKLRKLYKSKAS